MIINGIGTQQVYATLSSAKPAQPTAPIPPPGGNIENRQPPAQPTKPTSVNSTQFNLIDVYA